MELRNDGVQCAMRQSTRKGFRDMRKGFGDVGKASEVYRRYIGMWRRSYSDMDGEIVEKNETGTKHVK